MDWASNNIPIMIPTKGRAGKTKTDMILADYGYSCCFVVEPQDQDAYASTGRALMVLPENNQGIAYARQWILKQMRKLKYDFFWMMDDDINQFGKVVDAKCIQDPLTIYHATKWLLNFKFSLASLQMCQFAWSSKTKMTANKMAMQCVLFNVKRCENLNYDLNLKIREDYDLSFQAFFDGSGTVRLNDYYYRIAPMKSQKGGMAQWYNLETEKEEALKLCKKWPGLIEPVRKEDRYDVKINWRKLR